MFDGCLRFIETRNNNSRDGVIVKVVHKSGVLKELYDYKRQVIFTSRLDPIVQASLFFLSANFYLITCMDMMELMKNGT